MVKKVVIVGGGFAGIKTAKTLGNRKDVEVVLIDRRNYHLFQPLLYQVATAGLSPADIAGPIRGILSPYKNVSVVMDNVTAVDLKNRKVKTSQKKFSYDFVMLACGAKHSYFAHPEWEENAPGLKTLEQATEIRRRVLTAFENAETEANPDLKKMHLTFVIVGGGPTGVELAGAIAEISRQTLMKDFRKIDPSRTRVILIEAGPQILPAFDPSLSKRAIADLEDLGVQVWTNTRVTDVKKDSVVLGDEVIKASTIIWAAGVQPSSLNKTLEVPLDKLGRVLVEKDLSIPGHPEAFVVGDQAHYPTEDGKGLPGLASVAMQEGVHAAKTIIADLKGRARFDFKYLDKGMMATIGRRRAIAQVGKLRFGGFIAWLLWLFIHVYFLIGFKNKFFVIWQWTYHYFTMKRRARLIVDKEWRSRVVPSRASRTSPETAPSSN